MKFRREPNLLFSHLSGMKRPNEMELRSMISKVRQRKLLEQLLC